VTIDQNEIGEGHGTDRDAVPAMPSPRDGLAVAVFPPAGGGGSNPYLAHLNAELERRGVRLMPAQGLSPAWVDRARGHVEVVHLHWLEYIVRGTGGGLGHLARAHVRAMRYILALRRLRSAGIRTVWTVHNRRPHERRYPWLDALLVRYTAAQADALVLHSQAAAYSLADDLRRPIRAWIAPHPHYRDVYPPDHRSRRDKRAAYGLDESSFVYLMFGRARTYKRIPDAIRSFRGLQDSDARLVIAGAPGDERIATQIRRQADPDPRVVTLLREIRDDEVSGLFELADAAVLNHREVFTSGALLLALSYGLPVVAPEKGSAREVVAPPALQTFAPGGLAQALTDVRTGDPRLRRRAALQAIQPFTFDALAHEVLKAYRAEGGTSISPSRAAS
jgi:beta-1,4-mannosyltransferase